MPPRPVTDNDGAAAAQHPSFNGTGGAAAWAKAANDAPARAADTTDKPDTAAGNPEAATASVRSTADNCIDSATGDEALMNALRNGEDAALAPLMQRWELPVKSFLLRLGVPSGDVEDIAQEAFVRLYLKRAAYRPGAAFKPWLLTLAANLGRNRLRWRLRRRESSIDALYEPCADNTPPSHTLTPGDNAPLPSAIAEQNQRRRAVRKVIDALPAKLRSAVVCVDLEGLSHAEAAQVLGCTGKAVENRLRRARERIRAGCAAWIAEESL